MSSSAPDTSPILFWKASEQPYGVFSQWSLTSPFLAPIPSDSATPQLHIFHSAEAYMMHAKALLFSDAAIASQILSSGPAASQRKIKALGRSVANFSEEVWVREREGVVERGTWAKFECPARKVDGEWVVDGEMRVELRRLLLGTGDRGIAEASPFDRIWGVGMDEREAREWWREKGSWEGKGENLLGRAIERVRERVRAEVDAEGEEEGKEKET